MKFKLLKNKTGLRLVPDKIFDGTEIKLIPHGCICEVVKLSQDDCGTVGNIVMRTANKPDSSFIEIYPDKVEWGVYIRSYKFKIICWSIEEYEKHLKHIKEARTILII